MNVCYYATMLSNVMVALQAAPMLTLCTDSHACVLTVLTSFCKFLRSLLMHTGMPFLFFRFLPSFARDSFMAFAFPSIFLTYAQFFSILRTSNHRKLFL